MAATWTILTPPGATGAIACVGLCAGSGEEMEAALAGLGIAGVGVGECRLREIGGVDAGLVARWTAEVCHLMPHGGVGVVRAQVAALERAGVREGWKDPRQLYPEAGSLLEARMLEMLARAASPLAIDLLLDQARRWDSGGVDDPELNRVLDRLVTPPLVVAIGAANVGKSTLVNALSGRAVSIVADEPGTTRDHVGVMLNLGGLVVRYLDTAGMRPTADAIEAEAQRMALEVVRGAELVLLMGDAGAAPPEIGAASELRVALRADLGLPGWRYDIAVSVLKGTGLDGLVEAVRERLVPRAAMEDPRAWRFWSEGRAEN